MRKTKLFSLLIILVVVLSGCINISSKDMKDIGGFFRSSDIGETWEKKNIIYTAGSDIAAFSTSNINGMSFDYGDDSAVYLSSSNDGIMYSYNHGDGWFNTLREKGSVNNLVIDPYNKCIVYAAIHNTIYKTNDCSRHWASVYFETGENQYITSINVHYNNHNIVYAGTSGGSLLKSKNGGNSWNVIKRFNNSIKKILVQNISGRDIIYVATQSNGIYRSYNNDNEWSNLMELPVEMVETTTTEVVKFEDIKSSKVMLDLELDKSVDDGLIYANKIGIFRLLDGSKWKQIKLLTAPSKESIYDVMVNENNGNEIIYVSSKALYYSVDGGINWKVKGLPSSQLPGELRFSPDGKYIYLGVYKIK